MFRWWSTDAPKAPAPAPPSEVDAKSAPLESKPVAPELLVPAKGLGLAASAPHAGETPGARVSALAQQDVSDFATIKLVARPTATTPTRATYRLGGPDGLRLRSGEQILLEIPAELAGRPIYQAVMEHRQVQTAKTSVPTGTFKKWDETPGITALQFHSTAEGDGGGWRYWNAPWGSSGSEGGKYAELRPDWESESHFDFARNGTTPVGGGDKLCAVLTADALRLRGVGVDPTFVRSVTITFAPPAATHTEELVFTPGTKIGELLTAKGQVFGKDFEKGTYPGALEILEGGSGGVGVSKLSQKPGWKLENGRLSIPLEAGKILSGVEIACGDTKPDGKPNTDGEVGTQGKSRLKMGLQRAGTGTPEWFVDDHGVPPKGVLFGGPLQAHKVTEGDRLVLAATVDPTYVMALRVSYTGA